MKKKLLMLALHLAANGTDAYFTNRVQHAPLPKEADPIARTFVSHGQPLLITYFAAAFAVESGVEWKLRKHEKIAFGVQLFDIADHTAGAAVSAHGYRRGKR